MSEHRLSEITIERPRGGMRIRLKKTTGYRKQMDKLMREACEGELLRPYLLKPRNKSKHLSDHLNPLRRFLRSCVGQPWNVVYSELCQRLSANTLAGQHVRSHIWDFVERHVELIDGLPYQKASHWCRFGPLYSGHRDFLYIHPDTGILCLAARKPPQRPQPREDRLVVDAYRRYQKIDEIWYLITFREIPTTTTEFFMDVLKRAKVSYKDARQIQGMRMYASNKKQCNKKAVRFIQRQLARRSRGN